MKKVVKRSNEFSKHYKRAKKDLSSFHSVSLQNDTSDTFDIHNIPSTSYNCDSNLTSRSRSSSFSTFEGNFLVYQASPSSIINSDSEHSVESLVDINVDNTQLNHPNLVDTTISEVLSKWALKHNITHIALNDLLKNLNQFHPDLPLDARTLQ